MAAPSEKPTLRDFGVALYEEWKALVSGMGSIVFTVVAFGVPATWQKALFAAIAIWCLWYAAYRVWRWERIARRAVERRLDSRFEFSTNHDHALLTEWDNVNGIRYQIQRIAVTNLGAVDAVPNAFVKLANVSPCPASLHGRLPDVLRPVLVFGNNASDPFPMHAGDPVLVNVFTVETRNGNQTLVLWTTNPYINGSLPLAEYEIELIASGSPAQTELRRFKIGVSDDKPFIKFA